MITYANCHTYLSAGFTPEYFTYIYTMDLNSLHTNIPHTDCINACRPFLNGLTTDQSLINS